MTITDLNQHFGIEKHLYFIGEKNGLPIIKIDNDYASASISVYGAHVLSYRPKNEPDLLWLSPQSAFEIGKPIRGGIPVCFPWFGPHPSNDQLPVHGFFRLQMWEVVETSMTTENATQLKLALSDNEQTRQIWSYSFKAEFIITIGIALEVSLTIINTGKEAFTTTDSLHTYFHVKSLEKTVIDGLGTLSYYDPALKDQVLVQEEEGLVISNEENRRYFTHDGTCVLQDKGFLRDIHIEKVGSKVTVIWNPWKETVKKIGDIPDSEYLSFVCIEQVNAYDDTTTLVPGASHTLGLKASSSKANK